METSITVGGLLSTSLAIFLRRILQLAGLAAVAYLPYMFFTYWISTRPDQFYLALLALPVMMLCGFIVQGAITVATYHDLRGQGFQLGTGISRAMGRILPLLGLSIATSVMIGLASMLLIIPGIMVQCALFVAIPALMVEKLGISDAISRSFELTAGYRLKIFGLILLLVLIVSVPAVIINVMLTFAVGEGSVLYQVVSAFISGLAGSASAVAAVVTYYRLREEVDGVGLEQLDEVFA